MGHRATPAMAATRRQTGRGANQRVENTSTKNRPKDARAASPAARTLSKDIETSAMMVCPPLAARAWHSARTANAVRTH